MVYSHSTIALLLSISVLLLSTTNADHPLSDEFIESINALNTTWKAGRNFGRNIPLEYIRNLLGVLDDTGNKKLPKKKLVDVANSLPDHFDAREKWPKCPTIPEIVDQDGCGSCWAVSSTSAMSDRVCIHSKAAKIVRISAEDLVSCCTGQCSSGCDGGYTTNAHVYYVKVGIVTGGSYNSKEGCKPYEFAPCDHSGTGTNVSLPVCKEHDTPACQKQCLSTYKKSYNDDKQFGKEAYRVEANQDQIKQEIFDNGPVVAVFTVYDDFFNYRSGVYRFEKGNEEGLHAVRIIGWGVEQDVPYWLVANSWNTAWGEKGYFKIRRGTNECGIEEQIVAGLPKL